MNLWIVTEFDIFYIEFLKSNKIYGKQFFLNPFFIFKINDF